MAESLRSLNRSGLLGHTRWVRISHWTITLSFLTLAFTGVLILMVHPRLYWGEVGNDLTRPLIELPISRNYHHGGWEGTAAFFQDGTSPITANRTYEIFNQNGWGRSLHFLAGWFLVVSGAIYLLVGIFTGHFRRHIVPRAGELLLRLIWRDVIDHLHLRIRAATGSPDYGLLQKSAYFSIVFVALPLMIITGMTMSPAITAAFPFLLDIFGGYQSTDPGRPGHPKTSEAYRQLQRAGFAAWRISVEGMVARPRTFSLTELKSYPARTQITRHVCEEGWSAIAEWTGVPLSRVFDSVDLLPTARFVSFYSYDDFVESIDMLDALHPQTILAYGMNGRDLPVPHGAPVRLRVERQLGYKSTKYLRRIVVTEELDDGGDKGGIKNGWAWYVGI